MVAPLAARRSPTDEFVKIEHRRNDCLFVAFLFGFFTRENGGDMASYITYLWYAGVEVGSAGVEQGAAERWKCLYKVIEDV